MPTANCEERKRNKWLKFQVHHPLLQIPSSYCRPPFALRRSSPAVDRVASRMCMSCRCFWWFSGAGPCHGTSVTDGICTVQRVWLKSLRREIFGTDHVGDEVPDTLFSFPQSSSPEQTSKHGCESGLPAMHQESIRAFGKNPVPKIVFPPPATSCFPTRKIPTG
jgi:hypothetical protein